MLFKRLKSLKKSTREEEERFAQALDEEKLTFKDRFAMLFSAFLVIVLPCLLILIGISLIALLLTGGLF